MKKEKDSPRPVLKARLEKFGSYEKAAHFLVNEGVQISSSYLNMMVKGTRDPSIPLSRKIAKALELKLMDVVGEDV